MISYLQLDLGGVKRGLKFNMMTCELLEEITGQDPLQQLGIVKDRNFKELKGVVFDIFYAALLSNCKSKKEEPDFTKEQALDWFNFDLHPVYLYKIIQAFNSVHSEFSANGEGGKESEPVTFPGA
jgi:hypothetical protein